CDQGYESKACEKLSRDKFLGLFTYESDFVTSVQTSTISVGKYTDDELWKVQITNVSSTGDTKAYAVIDGTSISIPKQNVTGQGGSKFSVESTESGVFADSGTEISFTIKVSRTPDISGATPTISEHKYFRLK